MNKSLISFILLVVLAVSWVAYKDLTRPMVWKDPLGGHIVCVIDSKGNKLAKESINGRRSKFMGYRYACPLDQLAYFQKK